MRLRPPLSSLHPPLSATTGENVVESSINRFRVKLNIGFEFSAVRELAQKVGGGSPLRSCFFLKQAIETIYIQAYRAINTATPTNQPNPNSPFLPLTLNTLPSILNKIQKLFLVNNKIRLLAHRTLAKDCLTGKRQFIAWRCIPGFGVNGYTREGVVFALFLES